MMNYILMAIFAYMFYRFCFKGILWIVMMKLKYGDKISCFYFPFLGALIKMLVIPTIRYKNPHRNLVLERRENP
jgi:hypothetical protein